jgi:chemosensory pili system protein ChpB (putative protein-glutamate methylesterase)
VFKLGLIASERVLLTSLERLIAETAHERVCSALTDQVRLPLQDDVDVWVLRIGAYDEQVEALLAWFDETDRPVVLDDMVEPLEEFALAAAAKHLASKIATAASSVETQSRERRRPDRVWALGASAGGPEAVIAFFKALSVDSAGPNNAMRYAFVYAQHIDESGFQHLKSSVEKQSKLKVKVCEAGMPLEAGTIYLVPLNEEIEIEVGNHFAISGKQWKGVYRPSIDQVLAKIAKAFRSRSGAIIFSGMGDDGSAALRMVKAAGGKIYAQQPGTCAVDAMPVSAIETGCVDLVDSVDNLAQAVRNLA